MPWSRAMSATVLRSRTQLRAGGGDVAADRGADLDLRLQQLAASTWSPRAALAGGHEAGVGRGYQLAVVGIDEEVFLLDAQRQGWASARARSGLLTTGGAPPPDQSTLWRGSGSLRGAAHASEEDWTACRQEIRPPARSRLSPSKTL